MADRVHIPSAVFYIGDSEASEDNITLGSNRNIAPGNNIIAGQSLRRQQGVVFDVNEPTTHEYSAEQVEVNVAQMFQFRPVAEPKKCFGITSDKWIAILAVVCAICLLSLVWEEMTKSVPKPKAN